MTTDRTDPPTWRRTSAHELHWRSAFVTSSAVVLAGVLLWVKAVPCVFAHLFHVPCPGCGSTRAVLALLHGDFGGLLRYNPFGPAAALLMAVVMTLAIVSSLFRGNLSAIGEGALGVFLRRGAIAVAVAEFGVWIARFFGFLGGPVPV